MDRLISEKAVLDAIADHIRSKSNIAKLIVDIQAIPSVELKDSEDKIIRRTLENFMRGLWEEIQVGELEYTTSEVYEMLEREIFTDNHVAISSVEPKTGHWIAQDIHNCHTDFKCSECGYIHSFMHLYGQPTADYTYCPNCGARMIEPQENNNVNCKTTKCENCTNHNYCDYEPQERSE